MIEQEREGSYEKNWRGGLGEKKEWVVGVLVSPDERSSRTLYIKEGEKQ